jgi:hypothetical protein
VFPSKRARSDRSIPDSTRSSLTQRLVTRQRERWPQLRDLQVRVRGHFAYVDGVMPDGELWPLFRLRYGGPAHYWGFAFYTASSDSYQDSVLPTGTFGGTPGSRPGSAGKVVRHSLPQSV